MKWMGVVSVIALLLLLSVQPGTAVSPGFGARAIGMGGAYSAVADDGTAAYWNPAGITQLRLVLTPAAGMQGEWERALDFLAKLSAGEYPELAEGKMSAAANLGLGLNTSRFGLNVFGDLAMRSEKVDGPGEVQIDGRGQGVLTLAREFTPLLAVGANLKYVYVAQGTATINEEINYGSGSGWALDLGALFRVRETIRAAVVVRDYSLGAIKLSGEEYTGLSPVAGDWTGEYELPAVLVLGGALKIPAAGTLLAAELESPLAGGESRLRVGLEQPLLPLGLLAVRVGGFAVEDGYNYTAGFGAKLGPVVLDMAGVWSGETVAGIYLTAGIQF